MAFVASLLASVALSSGLHGTVMRGPTMPVCRVGEPCSAPAANVPIGFVRNDRTYATKTDDRGRYRIALAPGTYTIVIAKRYGMSYSPRTVTVPKATFALRNISIDTGIR